MSNFEFSLYLSQFLSHRFSSNITGLLFWLQFQRCPLLFSTIIGSKVIRANVSKAQFFQVAVYKIRIFLWNWVLWQKQNVRKHSFYKPHWNFSLTFNLIQIILWHFAVKYWYENQTFKGTYTSVIDNWRPKDCFA